MVLLVTRNRIWALSVLIGDWAHSITDMFDSSGVMLFFPFTTEHISTGAWTYAAQVGRYDDSGAYFSSLGLVMDGVWMVIGFWNWRVLTSDYFRTVVVTTDPTRTRGLARTWRRDKKGVGNEGRARSLEHLLPKHPCPGAVPHIPDC